VGLGVECVLVNDISVWVWGSEFVLCAEQYVIDLGE